MLKIKVILINMRTSCSIISDFALKLIHLMQHVY